MYPNKSQATFNLLSLAQLMITSTLYTYYFLHADLLAVWTTKTYMYSD